MHLVNSTFYKGLRFKEKSISKHRIFYIYSGSRDRNHKGTYTELQCKLTAVTHLGKNKIQMPKNTGEIRYSIKKLIPFQLDILIYNRLHLCNYNLVILELNHILDPFHQREHPTPPSCFKGLCGCKLRFETILKIYEYISLYSVLGEKNPSAF